MVPLLLYALLALAAGAFVCWLFVKWLSLPHSEQPATMILVGSRSQSTKRVSRSGVWGWGEAVRV